MRLFLAINPPAALQQAIGAATSSLRESADISWVPEQRLHLTLKFLGEQPESAVEPLRDAMRVIAQNHAPSVAALEGIGAFPNFRRPRVIWMGIDPEARLELLHHDVEVACDALGHPLEGKAFRPHITLGRVRERLSRDRLEPLRSAADKVRFSDMLPITSIDLMQSVTGRDRSPTTRPAGESMNRYINVFAAALGRS
jgi:2'-5' RNA ligase